MKINFKKLTACLLAILMVAASFPFTVTAADYADISTVSSAVISEIKVNEPLDYKVGEDMIFKFQLKSGSTVVTAPYLSYSATMDDGRKLTGYVEPVDGVYTVTLAGGLRRPGFVWMSVRAADASKNVISAVSSYLCGAGAEVTEIYPIYGKPDYDNEFGDFEAFWEETLAPLSTPEGKPTIKFIKDLGTKIFNLTKYQCYELEISCPTDEYFNTLGTWTNTNHVMAYLTIPMESLVSTEYKSGLGLRLLYKGRDLISASGSNTSIEPQSSICNSNSITLSVSPHSVPAPHNVAEADIGTEWVDGDHYIGDYYKGDTAGGYLYETYGYTKSHGNNATENASPHTTYYKYMLMRDVQALNFLKLYFGEGVEGYEDWVGIWDGQKITTNGVSQGGYQALAVAGLSNGAVTSVSAGVPWFADQGVVTEDSDRYKPSQIRSGYGEGLHYVDTAHLASLIDPACDVQITIGLNDIHVPPSTALSIYNSLRCNVSLTACQSQGHSPDKNSAPYYETISKTSNTNTENVVNAKTEIDETFFADFNTAWSKVAENSGSTVDIYVVDKNTTVDFKALATSSTADAIGVVLTGTGLTNINAKLAEIYSLHNDVNSKVWVIENDGTLNGENAAIVLDACMNWGGRPTTGGEIKLYTADGVLGQTSVTGSNTYYALIPTPLWVSAQGILVDGNSITLEDGKIYTDIDDASVTFTSPALSATYNMTGVGDAAGYGNIEGVGLWIAGNDGTLTIKGKGAIPAYASYSSAPWSSYNITKVDIFEGITAIGDNAFAVDGATVTVPVSVTEIAESAIKDDATIVSYDNAYAKTFAEQNGNTFTNLGATGSAGTDLTWLLDISTGVLTIDGTGTTTYSGSGGWGQESKSVFYPYQDKIKTIKFCDSVTNIGSNTFYGISGLTTVELTKNITKIGEWAFGGCANLSTIYVKGNDQIVGTYDLSYITTLSGSLHFDGSGQSVLQEVKFSDALTCAIPAKFISYNSSLTKVEIPEAVTSLDDRAFFNCSKLKTLVVNGKDTAISSNFLKTESNTTKLTAIYGVSGSSAETYANDNDIPFYLMENVIAIGNAGDNLNWKIVIENGERVMYIYGTGTRIRPYDSQNNVYGFSGTGLYGWDSAAHEVFDFYPYSSGSLNKLTKIVIQAPVTRIDGYTFNSFKYVKTIELPESLKNWEWTSESCFNGMSSLDTVYTTGQTVVEGTANLSNFNYIPAYAFANAAFKNIIFGENTAISIEAFRWNTALESVEISEGSTLGENSFVGYKQSSKNKLTTISFPKSMTTVQYSCFGVSDYSSVAPVANPFVTTITINNPDAVFEGATEEAPYSAFLNNFTALTTVNGYSGSTAEEFVNWANAYFAENAIDRSISFVDLDDDAVASGEYQGAKWSVSALDDGKYSVTISGEITTLPNAWGSWDIDDEYKTNTTIVRIKAPITVLNRGIQNFKNIEILELPVSCKSIEGHALSENMSNLHTVYTYGQEVEEKTFNLSNITTIGSFALDRNALEKIIFAENVSIGSEALSWENKLKTIVLPENISSIADRSLISGVSTDKKWQVSELEFPAGWSAVPAKPFYSSDYSWTTSNKNNNTTITTITVKNPEALFVGSYSETQNDYETFVTIMKGLTTVKGYSGSTAEEFVSWANAYFAENAIDRSIKFEKIVVTAADIVSFDGYKIREITYNGLRSMFSVDLYAMAAFEAMGFKVIEYGGLLAATEKLEAAEVELTIFEKEDGVYGSHDFAAVKTIYKNGYRVGNILSESKSKIEYACTVTYFSAENYMKNVTFRGYVIYEDEEGNDYVVYSDLIGSDGLNYNSTNLEFVCERFIAKGADLSNNICWLDIQKFKGNQ